MDRIPFMNTEPSTAKVGISPDVRLLVENMIKLKANIWIEKSKNKIFASKLMDGQRELFDAEKKNFELRLKTENMVRELRDMEKKASSFESNIKQYDALISQLPSVSEELDEDTDCDVSAMREIQTMAQKFLKESNSSPWILEKRQHLHGLQEDENRLEITKRQLSLMENKIYEKKRLLEEHNSFSMQKFCLTLASFSRNRNVLKGLLMKEGGIRRDMKKKMCELLDTSSMDESSGCDGEEPSGYLAFRRKAKKSLPPPQRPQMAKSMAHFSPKFLAPRPPPTFFAETHAKKDNVVRVVEVEEDLSQSSVEDDDNEQLCTDDSRNEEQRDDDVDHNKPKEISTLKIVKSKPRASQFFLHFNPANMNLETSNDKNPFGF